MSLILVFLFSVSSFAKTNCEEWFIKSNIEPGTASCSLKCTTQMVDMEFFSCPAKCEKLCSTELPKLVVDSLSYVQGITEGDKKMIAKYPMDAYQAYRAREQTQKLTRRLFKKIGRNDESDAFRHFVWAGLLVKSLGPNKARLFLEAHEQDPSLPDNEKQMDIYNNNQGVNFALKNKEGNKYPELDKLESEALSQLKLKKLKVLSPKVKKIPEPYYDEN